MKYFLDTEFHEYKKKPLFGKGIDTVELISIGIVCEKGKSYYAISKDFDIKAAWNNEWLRHNVLINIFHELLMASGIYGDERNLWEYNYSTLSKLIKRHGKSNKQIAEEIKYFVSLKKYGEPKIGINNNDLPEFYGYYCDYDWVVFCWLFGRMIDLPKGFPMYCRDLKQMFDEKCNASMKQDDKYPKQGVQHNALFDAKWNLELYKFLQTI